MVSKNRRIRCSTCQGKGERVVGNGQWLKAQREKAQFKRAALAAEMGISEPYIYMVEANKRPCSPRFAEEYMTALERMVKARG